MPYVTCGTVQFVTDGSTFSIQITPIQEYAIMHRKEEYIAFADTADPPGVKMFSVKKTFNVSSAFKEILVKAAIERTCLEVQIDDKTNVVAITVPATP